MELGHNQLPVILSVTGSLAGLASPNLGRDNQIMNYFQRRQVSIRNKPIQWEIYRNAELIDEKELAILNQLDRRINPAVQQFFDTHTEEIITVLFRILKDLKNEESIEIAFAILIDHLDDTCKSMHQLKTHPSQYIPILFRFVR
jgi:hypothetical protein